MALCLAGIPIGVAGRDPDAHFPVSGLSDPIRLVFTGYIFPAPAADDAEMDCLSAGCLCIPGRIWRRVEGLA